MQLSEKIKQLINEAVKKGNAKRLELEEIKRPYMELIKEIESEQKKILAINATLQPGNNNYITPLFWRKNTAKYYNSKSAIFYSLTYQKGSSYHEEKSAHIEIEERPELKKYKYTVTNNFPYRWGKNISLFETTYNDEMTEKECKLYTRKRTNEATPEEKIIMVERWQCRTLEEAEKKAAEIMQAVNKCVRKTSNYKMLVDLLTGEIDQLDKIEDVNY